MRYRKIEKKAIWIMILLAVTYLLIPESARIFYVRADSTSPNQHVFFPLIEGSHITQTPAPIPTLTPTPTSTPVVPPAEYRVNAPYTSDWVNYEQAAIFWFGRVSSSDVSTDVRVGYSSTKLEIYLQIIDRHVWYDQTPSLADLTNWDSVELYVAPESAAHTQYRFIGQINDWEPRTAYQAAYMKDSAGWQSSNLGFTTIAGYRGGAIDDNSYDARGWVLNFEIPFSSFGMSSAPTSQSAWKMALVVHNRDNATGPMNLDEKWPGAMDPSTPSTWGQLVFGLPQYTPAASTTGGTATIRQGLNGAVVDDASVGGWAVCGEGTDFFDTWGDKNESFYEQFGPSRTQMVIQNQSDISDFPCFSRYYVTFPLGAVPANKVIQSAKLTLYQFGNSEPDAAKPSYIQVLRIAGDWNSSTVTWNNGPQAIENYPGTIVDPLKDYPGDAGVARTWDVTTAVYDAYLAGSPLKLAMYEADSAYHSGKYFITSDAEDWNAGSRPTLVVTWGNPK